MSPIDRMFETVAWEETGEAPDPASDLPYATHAGVLELFDLKLRCYRLSTGQNIFHADDLKPFFDALGYTP